MSPTRASPSPALGEQLAVRIEQLILETPLEPGTPRVERTLASRLMVSRSPVRAALQLLAERGTIGPRPQGSYVVRRRKQTESSLRSNHHSGPNRSGHRVPSMARGPDHPPSRGGATFRTTAPRFAGSTPAKICCAGPPNEFRAPEYGCIPGYEAPQVAPPVP